MQPNMMRSGFLLFLSEEVDKLIFLEHFIYRARTGKKDLLSDLFGGY